MNKTDYRILGVSGNRPHKIPSKRIPEVKERLQRAVNGFKLSGGEVLIQGGALGVDQWAATAALEVGLEVWTYVPFPQQSDGWAAIDKDRYEKILNRSSFVKVFGEEPNNRLYFARNAAIIKDSEIMLTACSSADGGGAWVTKECKRIGKPLVEVKIGEDGLDEAYFKGGH